LQTRHHLVLACGSSCLPSPLDGILALNTTQVRPYCIPIHVRRSTLHHALVTAEAQEYSREMQKPLPGHDKEQVSIRREYRFDCRSVWHSKAEKLVPEKDPGGIVSSQWASTWIVQLVRTLLEGSRPPNQKRICQDT